MDMDFAQKKCMDMDANDEMIEQHQQYFPPFQTFTRSWGEKSIFFIYNIHLSIAFNLQTLPIRLTT